MKWINLTDTLFHNSEGHTFVIHKTLYGNMWAVICNKDNQCIARGQEGLIGKAKSHCKDILQSLKQGYFNNENK